IRVSARRGRRSPRRAEARPPHPGRLPHHPHDRTQQQSVARADGRRLQFRLTMRGVAVKKLLCALWMISLLVPVVASAQPFTVDAAGVTNGHWHLNSKDIEANKKIFVAMGGTLITNGNFQIVRFPGVLVYLNQGA